MDKEIEIMERHCEAARRELQEWIQARADTDRAVDGQGRPLTHRERRPSPRSPTAPPIGDIATLREFDRIAAIAIEDDGGKPSF